MVLPDGSTVISVGPVHAPAPVMAEVLPMESPTQESESTVEDPAQDAVPPEPVPDAATGEPEPTSL